MDTHITTPQSILTDADVAVLNAARSVLEELQKSCRNASYAVPADSLRVGEPDAGDFYAIVAKADTAAEAVFTVLNWMHAHGVRRLTDDQLHNRS